MSFGPRSVRAAAAAFLTGAALITITAVPANAAQNTYTAKEVAQHSSARDCWTIINGGVYDLTKWIYQHPGGSRPILATCGRNGSSLFNAQHGGQSSAKAILGSYKIGRLGK